MLTTEVGLQVHWSWLISLRRQYRDTKKCPGQRLASYYFQRFSMPQTPPIPRLVTLIWGNDQLNVSDPGWIARIVAELGTKKPPRSYERYTELRSPLSQRDEHLAQAMGVSRHRHPNDPPPQIGYAPPEVQNPVAVEALKELLGLELPMALNFTQWGRSRHRMIVAQVELEYDDCYSYTQDNFKVCWRLSGYQLYHSHRIGQVQSTPWSSSSMGDHIEKRLLNGQWVRWGFNGPEHPPEGLSWSYGTRYFNWAGSGAKRVGSTENDFQDLYEPDDAEDNESELSQQQEGV